eukprot:EG_transcript_41126
METKHQRSKPAPQCGRRRAGPGGYHSLPPALRAFAARAPSWAWEYACCDDEESIACPVGLPDAWNSGLALAGWGGSGGGAALPTAEGTALPRMFRIALPSLLSSPP